jgi:hypothetical protein
LQLTKKESVKKCAGVLQLLKRVGQKVRRYFAIAKRVGQKCAIDNKTVGRKVHRSLSIDNKASVGQVLPLPHDHTFFAVSYHLSTTTPTVKAATTSVKHEAHYELT